MKRLLLVFLVLLMVVSTFGAFSVCGAAGGKKVTLRWFQFQIEVAEQVKKMAETYHKEHPNVTIEVDVMGSGYYDLLKTKAASGDMPDVFMTAGYNEIRTYKDYVLDLSKEPFVAKIVDAAKPCISLDGKIVGLPVQMSGNGLIYNKKIFADNGLKVPKTLTELREVCQKLKSKGITPFANQFKDDWLLGQFIGSGFAAIPQLPNYMENVTRGKATIKDAAFMSKNLDLLDLMLKYGQENPLDADWNGANTLFAQGKAAMIFEGIWIYDTVKSISPNLEIGLFAVPLTDDPKQTRLTSDVNGVWHIYKKSKHLAEAKKVLAWIANSQSGHDFITKECKFIPAYKGVPASLNSLCTDVMSYLKAKNTYSWPWPSWPDGFYTGSGKVYQDYILGAKDKAKTLEALDALWTKLSGSR